MKASERKGVVDEIFDEADNTFEETVNTVQSVDIEERQLTTMG